MDGNASGIKRAFGEYHEMPNVAKRKKFDGNSRLNLPTELWLEILEQAIYLNELELKMCAGKSLLNFNAVCQQWHGCRIPLLIRLLNSNRHVCDVFYFKESYDNPLSQEIASFFSSYGTNIRSLNLNGLFLFAPALSKEDDFVLSCFAAFDEHSRLQSERKDKLSFLLSCCSNLQKLSLKGSILENISLSPLSSYTNLEYIDISWCKPLEIQETIDLSFLSSHTNLQHLNVEACRLVTPGTINAFCYLTNLRYLNITGSLTEFADKDLCVFAGHRNLQFLNIENTRITHKSFSVLCQITTLVSLNFSSCQEITPVKSSYDSLSALKNLTYLNMGDLEDGISDECFEFVQKLTNLYELDIHDCHIHPSVSSQYLQLLPSLRSLSIGTDEDFGSDEEMEAIVSLSQLTALNMETGIMGVDHISLLTRLVNLNKLEIGVQEFSDKELGMLSNLTALKELALVAYNLEDDPMDTYKISREKLTQLSALEVLSLEGTTYIKPFDNLP